MTNTIAEIENTDVILVTGSNTTEGHPIIGRRIKRAVERRNAKLIVIDPRKIELVKFAHIWLRPLPGTEVAWINGMIHVILNEGLWAKDYVAKRTEGFEELCEAVASYTPERVEAISGIPAQELARAARLYAEAPKAMILYAMGITQHTSGTDNVKALANLAMLCGKVGIEGGGLNPLRGQNNVQGACDMGALPNTLPGYQKVTDENVLASFQQAWGTGVRLSNRVGMASTDMTKAILQGTLRGLYIMGENPVMSDANASEARKAFEDIEFLVVQDIFLSETAQLADVVLPAASFAEKDGTFTNTERRVQRVRKAIEPPGQARADWEILADLAQRLAMRLQVNMPAAAGTGQSFGSWSYHDAEDIFNEAARLAPAYAGISYERLEQGGIQWPCPSKYHPGTPILHSQRFARGLGKFFGLEWNPPAEMPDEEYPFYLSTGRIRYHYHTGTMTRRSKGLNRIAPEGRIEINPQDAQPLGIVTGERVRVISRRGSVEARVRLTERSAPGMVFGTFHFSETPINQLTNDALDPVAKIPELKVCAVRVEKIKRAELAALQPAIAENGS